MNITLKNEDTLSITLPNGNKVTISNHNNISEIEIKNIKSYTNSIKYISVTNFGKWNSISSWFEGGIKKVSKKSDKNWFDIGEDITLYKN